MPQHPHSDKSPLDETVLHPSTSLAQHSIKMSAPFEAASSIGQGVLCVGQSLGVGGSLHGGTGCRSRCAAPVPGFLGVSQPAATFSGHATAPLVEADDELEYDRLYIAVLEKLEHKH